MKTVFYRLGNLDVIEIPVVKRGYVGVRSRCTPGISLFDDLNLQGWKLNVCVPTQKLSMQVETVK